MGVEDYSIEADIKQKIKVGGAYSLINMQTFDIFSSNYLISKLATQRPGLLLL